MQRDLPDLLKASQGDARSQLSCEQASLLFSFSLFVRIILALLPLHSPDFGRKFWSLLEISVLQQPLKPHAYKSCL